MTATRHRSRPVFALRSTATSCHASDDNRACGLVARRATALREARQTLGANAAYQEAVGDAGIYLERADQTIIVQRPVDSRSVRVSMFRRVVRFVESGLADPAENRLTEITAAILERQAVL